MNQVLQRIRILTGGHELGCWRVMPFWEEEKHESVHRAGKLLGGKCAGELLRVQSGWQICEEE